MEKHEQVTDPIFVKAIKFGQEHLVQHYNSLTCEKKKESFLNQLKNIDFEKTETLYKKVYLQSKNVKKEEQPEFKPIQNVANRATIEKTFKEFNRIGHQTISKGEVGVCIMSGGQGTRLGFDHPKGMFDIGLDSHFTLFNFFARRLLRLMEIVKNQYPNSPSTSKNMIKWYIMTSEMNHQQVTQYFQKNKYFGYDPNSMVFFPQGGIPAVDYNGKIVIQGEGQISLAPGGNGAMYQEMQNKGVIKHMKDNGVKYIYVGPVDNILLKLADPTCLGYMVQNNFQIVSLSVAKVSADEKVGLHLLVNEKAGICQYSETPPFVQEQKDEKGEFVFKHGSRATMFITREMIERITTDKEVIEKINKKYHLAEKKIKYYDPVAKTSVKPQKNNGVKFQLFYFDVFEEAKKFGIFQTLRVLEFAPVKNADGNDSPATARELIRNLHKRWLIEAGIQVQGDGYVQIDPLLCYDGEGLQECILKKYGCKSVKTPLCISQ